MDLLLRGVRGGEDILIYWFYQEGRGDFRSMLWRRKEIEYHELVVHLIWSTGLLVE